MNIVHVKREGTGSPLVLFHGWGFDSRVWEPVLPLLKHVHEVFCVDLPGFGLSSEMEWEEFKLNLLKQLPERFALVGWSLGGLVATRLALELLDRTTHLIQLASSPYFVEEYFPQNLDNDELKIKWPGITTASLAMFQKRLNANPKDLLSEFVALQFPGQKNCPVQIKIGGLRTGFTWLTTWDFREKLRVLRCPVLYIFGRRDRIVPIMTMHILERQYPHFRYHIIEKAAHALCFSHSDPCINIVLDFLKPTLADDDDDRPQ